MIKAIKKFFRYLFETTELGFYQLSLILSKGFFFYFYLMASLFEKIFHWKGFKNTKEFFKNKQGDPIAFLMLVLFFFIGVFLHTYLYVDKEDIKFVDSTILQKVSEEDDEEQPTEIASDKETYSDNEINLYRKYGKWDIKSFNFYDVWEVNSRVVAWLMVDGTSVNYPIVQGDDNDFYLNHDITTGPKASGWTFMDFRNNPKLEDNNTIFYGHNLLNRTSFGSLANVFTDKWFNNSNHLIVVRTPDVTHIYEIFACYYVEPEVYYLQTNFYDEDEYDEFLDTIKSRSKYNFGVDLSTDDKIITLSTCTDDNRGRKVIHAKMIE